MKFGHELNHLVSIICLIVLLLFFFSETWGGVYNGLYLWSRYTDWLKLTAKTPAKKIAPKMELVFQVPFIKWELLVSGKLYSVLFKKHWCFSQHFSGAKQSSPSCFRLENDFGDPHEYFTLRCEYPTHDDMTFLKPWGFAGYKTFILPTALGVYSIPKYSPASRNMVLKENAEK